MRVGWLVTCHSPLVTACITCRKCNDASRPGQNFLRLDALRRVAFEPLHLAVIFLSEPVLELFRACGRSGSGETAIIETKFQRALSDFFFHRRLDVARRNCRTICCATSRTERNSVFNSTSACL